MTARPPPPTFAQLFAVFGRIGLLSFGGPAAQIALMHRDLVEERSWLSEDRFLRALSFCMLLPGPEAMQLATYCGWRMRGTAGGLLAGLLFVLPGAVAIFALAWAYSLWGALPATQALFLGIKATVVVIVLDALHRVARRALTRPDHWVLAGAAFLALFAFDLPFPLVIAAAAAWGALARAPEAIDDADPDPAGAPRTGRTVAIWLTIWLAPVAALWASGATLLTGIAVFFAKLAVVTFGGAYAVLAYMTQEAVEGRGWLTADQMLDALGLAETTPGPLILVTQFVGFLAGAGAGGLPLAVAAALVTLWVTFAPCFLWIFAGAPYLDALSRRPRLKGALAAITAAVVGVILNLSIWFAMHVFFAHIATVTVGPVDMPLPVPNSFSPLATGLAMLAGGVLIGLRWPLPIVLGLAAAAGLLAGIPAAA
ncbi:chromate efflux transporter [Mesobaculum littorinae]|uniref:Chromate efflux transporter n=1 Tax=Mesobaculum littorinae TaxID=2486419 RepID=A0A438AIR4_9RHOB|nr:chromate efflux transporter [Mesobaculum littorinae]RVV98653.1 chromate efflux transporter [Mesobaculum littorinae]